MSEQSQPINWENNFAWVKIFRAFRIALDIRKILLGSIALLLLMAIDYVIESSPLNGDYQRGAQNPQDVLYEVKANVDKLSKEAEDSLNQSLKASADIRNNNSFIEYQNKMNALTLKLNSNNKRIGSSLRAELARLRALPGDNKYLDDIENSLGMIYNGNINHSYNGAESSLTLILKPLDSFLAPLGDIIFKSKNWSQTAEAWTRLLFSIIVWSFFGLAISRMAAIQFARNEKIGLRASLNFSFEKYLAAVSAPIIPICGIGLFWFLGTIGGWIGNIPVIGEIVLGALWILPLCFGFAGILILIGLCIGWPLMVSAIGAEGSDGFDGFSRSFSYIYSKFWHYVWYVFVTLFYGFITISLFYIFVNGCCYLSTRMISTGAEINSTQNMTSFSTFVIQSWNTNNIALPFPGELENNLGRAFANYWLKAISLLCAGMAVSFFWTGTTIVYFLIRRADDATDFNEVYHPAEEVEDDLLPLVGIADSEQPTTTRPVDGVQNPDPPMEVDEKPVQKDEPDQKDEK